MHIAVIGAGIQGICVALEFARRGARVHLIEKQDAVMSGASRHNEGKIHLGFVYANDPTRATACLMSHAAVMFAPLLREHLESDLLLGAISEPFLYAVHARSLVSPDELEHRYVTIAQGIQAAAAQPDADYFGIRLPDSIRRLGRRELARWFDTSQVIGGFETREIAVDPDVVADALTHRIFADPRVTLRSRTSVTSASILPDGVELMMGDGSIERFDHVVNAGWCGRLAIDASAGIPLPKTWCFRRKWFLRAGVCPAEWPFPSTTIVLGGFGDIVRYHNGDTFLSWYPTGCTSFEKSLHPWATVEHPDTSERIRRDTVKNLATVAPDVKLIAADRIANADVRSGIIFARGHTDVDDPSSLLHQRHSAGPQSFGRYHTIDTGKYTTAPLFARRLVEGVCGLRRAA